MKMKEERKRKEKEEKKKKKGLEAWIDKVIFYLKPLFVLLWQ